MAKKKTPKKAAGKPAAQSTKGTGKMPAKRPLVKPAKRPAVKSTKRPLAKSAKRPAAKPAKRPATDTTIEAAESTKGAARNLLMIEAAAMASQKATQEAAKPEHTWVVWQDGRGIWVGTLEDFKLSKRVDSIVCDVIDSGPHQDSVALQRAVQVGQTLRQSYANYLRYWLQYNDAAQKQRIEGWQDRLRELGQ